MQTAANPQPGKEERMLIERAALRHLRKHNPEFFRDSTLMELAAIIISEFSEELSTLSPIQQVTMIAGVISLMFGMGSAAIRSIRCQSSMARIFIETYHIENPSES